jgi:hypothetical protein
MTLQEKFGEIWIGRGTFEEDCEKIADDFAIGFLNWYFDKGQWITKNLDVKGLLEIYKEEKGL